MKSALSPRSLGVELSVGLNIVKPNTGLSWLRYASALYDREMQLTLVLLGYASANPTYAITQLLCLAARNCRNRHRINHQGGQLESLRNPG